MTISQFLRPTEVAERLGLGKTAMYDLIKAGHIPHHKFGSSVRLLESDVEKYIEDTRHEAKPARKIRRVA